MEAFALIAALVASLGVVVAKAATIARLRLLERRIADVDEHRTRALDQLRATRAAKKVSEANKASLERKLTRLQGKRSRLQGELRDLGSEQERRELLREQARGRLIRPNRPPPLEDGAEGLEPQPGGEATDQS